MKTKDFKNSSELEYRSPDVKFIEMNTSRCLCQSLLEEDNGDGGF